MIAQTAWAPGSAAKLRRQAEEYALVDDPNEQTYSISLRLQRTTTEFAFVSVPVTPDLILEQSDGSGRLNVAQVVQRGLEMAQAPEIVWHAEEQAIQPHPVQTPPPKGDGSGSDG